MQTKKVVILIVCPYTSTPSAGIDNIHFICDFFRESGFETYLIQPRFRNTILRYNEICQLDSGRWLTHRTIQRLKQFRQHVVIYPDIVKSNFLYSRNVINYMMAFPKGQYPKSDAIFCHTDSLAQFFNSKYCVPIDLINSLCYSHAVPICSLPADTVVYARKYKLTKRDLVEIGEHVNISNFDNSDISAAGGLFSALKSSKRLIVFEPTRVILEAIALGCPVLFVANSYFDDNLSDNKLPGVITINGINNLSTAKTPFIDRARVKKYLHELSLKNGRSARVMLEAICEINKVDSQIRIPFDLRTGFVGKLGRALNSSVVKINEIKRRFIAYIGKGAIS